MFRKAFVLVFVLLISATAAFAQPESAKERRLKTDLRNLDRRFERLRETGVSDVNSNNENRVRRAIEAAEKELADFRTAHPEHDVSKYEKELNDFKSAQTNALEDKADAVGNINDLKTYVEKILDSRPEMPRLMSETPGANEEAENALKALKDDRENGKAAGFASTASSTDNREVNNLRTRTARLVAADSARIAQYDLANIRKITEPGSMLSRFFDIAFAAERMRVLKAVFPDEKAISDALSATEKVESALGDYASIKNLAASNYAAKVASVKMLAERQNNAALRTEFKNAFLGYAFKSHEARDSTVLKVHLVSSGWAIERNSLTGIILNRQQTAQIAFKATDGKCYLTDFDIKQNYDGARYGKGIGIGSREREMLCENVP
ncbi:MAG: hypothetical protein R2684_08345 [Pyrinomonadaceae bacterium]